MTRVLWDLAFPWPVVLAMVLVGLWFVWDLSQVTAEILVERIKAWAK